MIAPCPRCDTAAMPQINRNEREDYRTRKSCRIVEYQVICPACKTAGFLSATQDEAVADWNRAAARRAAPPPPLGHHRPLRGHPRGESMARKLADMTDADLRSYMGALGTLLKDVTPEDACFALLLFGRPDHAQYISNAGRGDMIRALRECADRLEAGMDNIIPPDSVAD